MGKALSKRLEHCLISWPKAIESYEASCAARTVSIATVKIKKVSLKPTTFSITKSEWKASDLK